MARLSLTSTALEPLTSPPTPCEGRVLGAYSVWSMPKATKSTTKNVTFLACLITPTTMWTVLAVTKSLEGCIGRLSLACLSSFLHFCCSTL